MPEQGSQATAPEENGAGVQDGQDERRRLEATLRDLIGRMEHVRLRLQQQVPEAAETIELVALLDTEDARLALGLNLTDPPCEDLQTHVTRRGLDDR